MDISAITGNDQMTIGYEHPNGHEIAMENLREQIITSSKKGIKKSHPLYKPQLAVKVSNKIEQYFLVIEKQKKKKNKKIEKFISNCIYILYNLYSH